MTLPERYRLAAQILPLCTGQTMGGALLTRLRIGPGKYGAVYTGMVQNGTVKCGWDWTGVLVHTNVFVARPLRRHCLDIKGSVKWANDNRWWRNIWKPYVADGRRVRFIGHDNQGCHWGLVGKLGDIMRWYPDGTPMPGTGSLPLLRADKPIRRRHKRRKKRVEPNASAAVQELPSIVDRLTDRDQEYLL